MSRTLTARLPDSVVDEVQRLAEAEQLSISEVVRRALVVYLKTDPETHFERLLFEIVKTRAFCVASMGTEADLDQAEETAREYVKEMLGKET